MTVPQAYPLTWPKGRLRRGGNKFGQFKYVAPDGWRKEVTVAVAVQRLLEEAKKLGAQNLLISSNLVLNRNGYPKSDQAEPGDPGVCAYFSLNGKAVALACDTYSKAAQNIAALAAHIEAVRAQERYGVASAEESLRAFEALAAPAEDQTINWRATFGVRDGAIYSRDEISTLYRGLAKTRAGNEEALKTLNIAKDNALKEART